MSYNYHIKDEVIYLFHNDNKDNEDLASDEKAKATADKGKAAKPADEKAKAATGDKGKAVNKETKKK